MPKQRCLIMLRHRSKTVLGLFGSLLKQNIGQTLKRSLHSTSQQLKSTRPLVWHKGLSSKNLKCSPKWVSRTTLATAGLALFWHKFSRQSQHHDVTDWLLNWNVVPFLRYKNALTTEVWVPRLREELELEQHPKTNHSKCRRKHTNLKKKQKKKTRQRNYNHFTKTSTNFFKSGNLTWNNILLLFSFKHSHGHKNYLPNENLTAAIPESHDARMKVDSSGCCSEVSW